MTDAKDRRVEIGLDSLAGSAAILQTNRYSLLVMLLLVVVLAAWNWRKLLSDWRYSAHIAAFVTGVLLLWILITRDPGNVWHWYLD